MKTPFLKTWLAAALCALALGSSAALAEPDSFGLGSGRNLALAVAGANTVINSYAPVTASLAAGSTSVPIGACTGEATCFTAGDLVMVFQTTGLVPVPASGTQDAVDLATRPVGRWELARLASASASTLELTAPLVREYAANVTQVIRVPEYTNVTIASGRSITAPAWDGSTGGIVAFLADGTVTNNGQINASALGFRGGQYVNDTTAATGCMGLDEPAPSGAQKGEGIANARYGATQTGRGNVANGAGGGVCFKSGGGGGGHGGAGGQGGRSAEATPRDVGGLGGAALTYPLLTQLTFGGGGGAGHGSDGTGVPGGRGGGTIFIRASQLTGTGSITASGGLGSATASDGGSGGGAGGSLYLRFVRTADCAAISATGGLGGNVNAIRVGPGGGGGGGRVLFQSAGGTCPIIATGSASGVQQDPTEPAYGAQPGTNGTSTVLPGGFVVPTVPTIITPANGSVTNNRRPPITGTAVAGAEVILFLDGNEVGRATADAAGNYSFTPPTDLADGSHTVQAVAEVQAVRSARSAVNTFTVDTSVPDTSIVSGPSGFTQERNPAFAFSATEPDVTYECNLNDAGFTPCPSPATFNELAEGAYTLQVRARDAAGNVDETPATRTFRVTGADLALLGSGCSATGGDASLVLLGLGTFTALARRRRRGVEACASPLPREASRTAPALRRHGERLARLDQRLEAREDCRPALRDALHRLAALDELVVHHRQAHRAHEGLDEERDLGRWLRAWTSLGPAPGEHELLRRLGLEHLAGEVHLVGLIVLMCPLRAGLPVGDVLVHAPELLRHLGVLQGGPDLLRRRLDVRDVDELRLTGRHLLPAPS